MSEEVVYKLVPVEWKPTDDLPGGAWMTTEEIQGRVFVRSEKYLTSEHAREYAQKLKDAGIQAIVIGPGIDILRAIPNQTCRCRDYQMQPIYFAHDCRDEEAQ
jgi:hypothetical protein